MDKESNGSNGTSADFPPFDGSACCRLLVNSLDKRMPPLKHFLHKPYFWLVCCLIASFSLLAYPVYVIRPFRYQGPTELAAALVVLQVRLYLQIALAIAAIGLFVCCWRSSRRILGRIFAALLLLFTLGFGYLSRVNIYELMFHPLKRPVFADASKMKLDGAEQVIAIKVNNAARAYPIRIISYHHIVNDFLAALPVVATY
jgi:Protein of unknown function (DUF3179)